MNIKINNFLLNPNVILILAISFFILFILFVMFKNKNKKNQELMFTEKYMKDKEIYASMGNESNYKDLSDAKSTIGGIIASQEVSLKRPTEELLKPIGWIVANSYKEDIKNANLQRYMPDFDIEEYVEPEIKKSKNSKIQILLVDDSLTVLKYIDSLLSKFNYDLILKEDGLQAFEYLEETEKYPDLIITDIDMPNMNGIELIKKIKLINKLNKTPIIVISSSPENCIELLETSLVNGIMKKPFDKKEFIEQIEYLSNNN